VLDGEVGQLGVRVEVQRLHDWYLWNSTVRAEIPSRDAISLAETPLRQKLENLALPWP